MMKSEINDLYFSEWEPTGKNCNENGKEKQTGIYYAY